MKIFVRVIPHSLNNKLDKVDEFNYLARVRDMPLKNKANSRVIKLISTEFGISTNKILIKNPKSRKKIIEFNLT